ncbi:hypothetical protein HYPSUDRAFT_208141 [Hypholoma sublateritium FD-334 SS-4]|uniref:Uncharacterized protein n=1 Tax=Hypholoma sublateritium (strain FD-334 SS-4) TaxID=945553 RepID=A0A0D2LWE3_HYPSF|nr:hypothetical protein HYPSUDRAFT_209296 [Hypholoma sublateritium FD-334 SS-4]KJA15158.1 hypothetical protein HYPSUDRAFT_208141 [Hypholoma sublateritium FD-334 SS-4]
MCRHRRHPRTEVLAPPPSVARESDAGRTALNIQSPLDLFEPRPTSSLLSLYEDDQLSVPIVEGIPLSPFPEETTKPVWRAGLPHGAQGIWDVLKWLLAECQIIFCQKLFHGTLVIAPGVLTRAVFEHARDNKDFKDLYNAYCQTPMAAHLAGGAHRNTAWTFEAGAIAANPLARVYFGRESTVLVFLLAFDAT